MVHPLLHQRPRLLDQLQLIAIIGLHLIRRLHPLDLCMTDQHHMDSRIDKPIQIVQKTSHPLRGHRKALPIRNLLQRLDLLFRLQVLDTQALRPVDGIQHHRLVAIAPRGQLTHHLQQLRPSPDLLARHIQMRRPLLHIQKDRLWHLGRQRSLPHAFDPINADPLGPL